MFACEDIVCVKLGLVYKNTVDHQLGFVVQSVWNGNAKV
jgi:hypothetical protein